MEFAVILLIGWVMMLMLGSYVSSEKGRGGGEGFVLAFLFGPFGILIVALLPSKVAAPQDPSQQRRAAARAQVAQAQDTEAQKEALRRFAARVEAERLAKDAEVERRTAERDRRKIEKREAYLARGITPGPLAWLESLSLSMMTWYKGASDLAQMAVWAVCLSIPAALLAILLFRSR